MNATAQAMQDDLTKVVPGTTMGNFMRHYWIPAALSSELNADGDPVHPSCWASSSSRSAIHPARWG